MVHGFQEFWPNVAGKAWRAASWSAAGMWAGGRSHHDGPGCRGLGQNEGPDGNFQILTLSGLFLLPVILQPPKGYTASPPQSPPKKKNHQLGNKHQNMRL